jgi:Zn-finger nucleic acid-binding protein
VWLCDACLAGATTVGVLRKVAPRAFVHHLWQAGLAQGRASTRRCPSCTQPLLELDGSRVELSPALLLCCRCFLVWLERPSLQAFGLERRPGRAAGRAAAAIGQATGRSEPERIARAERRAIAAALGGPGRTGSPRGIEIPRILQARAPGRP